MGAMPSASGRASSGGVGGCDSGRRLLRVRGAGGPAEVRRGRRKEVREGPIDVESSQQEMRSHEISSPWLAIVALRPTVPSLLSPSPLLSPLPMPLLSSGGRDGALCLWDLDHRRCLLRLREHRAALSGCAFVDAVSIVSCSLDRTMLLCDLEVGRRVRCFDDHDAALTSVVRLSSSLVASAASDASIKLWDIRADRPCVAALFDHDAAVYDLATMWEESAGESDSTATATQLLSASWDRTIKLWNLRMLPAAGSTGAGDSNEAKRCVRTLRGHTDAVRALVVLDGSREMFASAGWDKTIRVWDLAIDSEVAPSVPASSQHPSQPPVDPACVGVITGHTSWIYSLAYVPESGQIVSASGDKTLRISDASSMRTHTVLTGHQNTIWSVVALPSSSASTSAASSSAAAAAAAASSLIVSGGADSQIRLWDCVAKDCTRISGGHANDTAIHALDVWPRPDSLPANRKRLNLRKPSSTESTSPSASNAVTASSVEAASPSAATSSPPLLSDALERHGSFAFMRQSETETTYKSKDSGPDTLQLELSRGRIVTQRDRIPSSFTIVPAGFHAPGEEAPPTVDATPAAATPVPASAPSSPSLDLFATLAPLRERVLSSVSVHAWTDAEKTLLEMIAAVEAAQEWASPGSRDFLEVDAASPTATATVTKQRPNAAALSQLLFFLFHDASVVACKQGVPQSALRYATQALGCYDASSEDVDDAAESARALRERAVLLEPQQVPPVQHDEEEPDEFAAMIPSALVLQSQEALFDRPASRSASSPSAGAAASSSAIDTQSLLLPLLLRRFHSAYMLRDVSLCFELGTQLLSKLSSRDQARESMLDEIETIVLRSPALPPPKPKRGQTPPAKCLYSLLLHLWHEEILVAHVARTMEEINACKTRGNELFTAAARPAAAAGTPTAAVPASSSFSSPASAAAPHVSDPAGALVAYARGLLLAHELEDLFGDAEACPSYAWFELRAAQIPTTDAQASSSSTQSQQRLASGSWLLFGGHPAKSVPAFSRPALSFLHVTLYANYAQALLSASDSTFLLSASHRECILALHAAQTRHRKILPAHESFAPMANRAAWTKRVAEQGIARMEVLTRQLEKLREQVQQAQRSKYQGLIATRKIGSNPADEDHDDDDDGEDRNVFVENLSLGLALPSLSACSALASKLYFRHGAACLSLHDDADDSLAEASFALSQKLHPDPKVQREIERRKRERDAEKRKKQAVSARDPVGARAVKAQEEQKEQH